MKKNKLLTQDYRFSGGASYSTDFDSVDVNLTEEIKSVDETLKVDDDLTEEIKSVDEILKVDDNLTEEIKSVDESLKVDLSEDRIVEKTYKSNSNTEELSKKLNNVIKKLNHVLIAIKDVPEKVKTLVQCGKKKTNLQPSIFTISVLQLFYC